jgi:hypothetical protein
MAELPSIPRVSKQENLESLYRKVATTSNVSVDGYTGGIRSHLVARTTNTYAWGQSKKAGAPDFASTNAINGSTIGSPTPWDWAQPNFKVNQPLRVTQFQPRALSYAKNTLGLDNSNYFG